MRCRPPPVGSYDTLRRGAKVQSKVKMFVPSVAKCAKRSVRSPRLNDRWRPALNVSCTKKLSPSERVSCAPSPVCTSRS